MTSFPLLVVALVTILQPSTITTAAVDDTKNDLPAATVSNSDTGATSKSDTATPDSLLTLMQNVSGGNQLGPTTSKNADRYQSYQKACEAGYPCSKDQWCSPKQRICRPCSDLGRWCNETFIIHQNYTTCEDYCYRFQIEKTTQCEAEREEDQRKIELLNQTLGEAERNLTSTQKQAAETKTEIDQLNQQVQSLNDQVDQKQAEKDEMQADLDRLRDTIESLKEEKESAGGQVNALETGIALCVVISLVAIVLAIMYGPRIRRFIDNKFGTKQSQAEEGAEVPTSSTSLITEEGKAPVQAANRNSVCRDEYCIPGNGGRALDAHVPGDCVVSP